MKATSIQAINTAIKSLTDKGINPTQKAVQVETGLSIATIKRHWKERVSNEPSRVSILNESTDRRVSNKTTRVSDRVSKQVDRVSDRVSNSSTPSAFERLKRRKLVEEVLTYRPWLS